MIHQADDIRRFRAQKTKDAQAFFSQDQLAERLRGHLLEVYRMQLSKQQDKNLVDMIADRVTGVIDEETFNTMMMRGVTVGGLSLSGAEADSLTRYFEKLIAQGVDVSYKS